MAKLSPLNSNTQLIEGDERVGFSITRPFQSFLNQIEALKVKVGSDWIGVHIDDDGIVRIGDDSANYTQFEADGRMTHEGLAKVIKEVGFPLQEIGEGATAPELIRYGNVFGYEFEIGEDGYAHFEVPSDWDDQSGITLFLRTAINEAYALQDAEVRWQGTYSCIPDDESEAMTAAEHTGTLDSGDINIPAIKRGLQQVTLGTIPATDLALNDVLFILISRIALVDGVDPTAHPVVLQMGYEYVSNKRGESIV